MKAQISEVQAGQHIWVGDKLWLVESIRRSEFTGLYRVDGGHGTATFAADAMVQV